MPPFNVGFKNKEDKYRMENHSNQIKETVPPVRINSIDLDL
jgi:hypothetical protein